MQATCSRCNDSLKLNNGLLKCDRCGFIAPVTPNLTLDESNQSEHTEAETLFLSGSAYLSLKDYKKAAELFLGAAKLSPTEPKNWLYLLAAITERFTVLRLIADEKATRSAGNRKVVCSSVFKNFVATAKKDDFIFAKSEFDIDLDPDGEELWESILVEIIRADNTALSAEKAAALAHKAACELKRTHPQTALRYFPSLCRKLNPVREGVLEITTLEFYPDSDDGILRIDTDADSIEFSSDEMLGKERFNAFMLRKGMENIGTNFPFAELVVESGVTKIPDKLLGFCGGIETVRLSETVRVIGKQAFAGCVNLRGVSPLDNVTEIGDGAFFGTAIRSLDIPGSVKKLGKEILGLRKGLSDGCEISKYLIKLDYELMQSSEGFNAVGEHSCGYVVRQNGKLKLVYPVKRVGGKARSLTHDEKMIFKALAYASVDKDDMSRGVLDGAKDFLYGVKSRIFKKK